MASKLSILTISLSLCVFGATASTSYGQSQYNSNAQTNQRIDYSQHQTNQLQTPVKKKSAKKKKKLHKPTAAKSVMLSHPITSICQYNPSRVSIGPYLTKDDLFDGSELIVNTPSIREASRLLQAQAKLEQECSELAAPGPAYPRLTFSGYLEGQAAYSDPYTGSSVNNINLTGAELDTYVEASPLIHGFMALDYDPDDLNDGSKVFLNRAFILIGNLTQSPFYGEVGQIYVPFGRFSSLFITAPTTLGLARTRTRTVLLGFQQIDDYQFHAEAYAFQGLTNAINKTNTMNEGGVDAGYNFKTEKASGYLGGSLISDLADSQGLQSAVFLNNETLQHRVPAYDFYGSLSISPVTFIAEYVKAMNSFAISDVAYSNQGARPSAYNIEMDFSFHTGSKESAIGVTYQGSSQALTVGLPQTRYGVVYTVVIWKDTQLALEYRHDINYGASAATNIVNPTPANIVSDLGETDNAVTAQFDLYF